MTAKNNQGIMESSRKPGWDKKTINLIAKECYGGLSNMFEAHGWDADGKTYGQVAPTRVVETYGSVDAFELSHKNGEFRNLLLHAFAAIECDPPEVWLTSFYGFEPDKWGVLTFTDESARDDFIRQSQPGTLVVSYATKNSGHPLAGRLLGIEQITHIVDHSEKFIEPRSWQEKQKEFPKQWNFGVKAIRAWKFAPEFSPKIEDFANETYSNSFAQTIARRGKRLTSTESKKLLNLLFHEVSVYGGDPVEPLSPEVGSSVLKVSKAGPVSQKPFFVREAEGPKHLYILTLQGNINPFIEDDIRNRKIVKVGFSVSPENRKEAFNSALPGDQVYWEVHRSTFKDQLAPFPTSKPALAGEKRMKDYLSVNALSLGGEFFLANDKKINEAWLLAVQAAKNWKK